MFTSYKKHRSRSKYLFKRAWSTYLHNHMQQERWLCCNWWTYRFWCSSLFDSLGFL